MSLGCLVIQTIIAPVRQFPTQALQYKKRVADRWRRTAAAAVDDLLATMISINPKPAIAGVCWFACSVRVSAGEWVATTEYGTGAGANIARISLPGAKTAGHWDRVASFDSALGFTTLPAFADECGATDCARACAITYSFVSSTCAYMYT